MTTRMPHFALAALLTVGVIGCATDNPPSSATAPRPTAVQFQPQVIEGQVVQNEGDAYIIREQSGRQTRVRIDRYTVRDDIAVGDVVVARFAGPSSSTYATSITRSTGYPFPLPANVSSRFRTVEGTVLQQYGNYYVIRDNSGRDVRVHVDSTTRLDRDIRPGDRVVVTANDMVSDAMYANNVYRLDRPQTSQGEDRQIILGEVMRTDADRYVVRDLNGREMTLHVDNTTELSRNINAGDQVVAINAKPANSPYETAVYSMYKRTTVNTIQGEVIRTDGNEYIVRDVTGRDVRFRDDSTTLRNENVRVGDRIVVYAGPSSIVHADSIERR